MANALKNNNRKKTWNLLVVKNSKGNTIGIITDGNIRSNSQKIQIFIN